MFGKRAQAAMEYLMNYWWAILLAIIVGGALWKMGIFRLGSTLAGQASKVEAQAGTVAIIDHAISGTGASVAIVNNGNTIVNITKVYLNNVPVNSTNGGVSPGPGAQTGEANGFSWAKLDPGERATFSCSASACTCTSGNPYKLNVTYEYYDEDTGINHTQTRIFTGTC